MFSVVLPILQDPFSQSKSRKRSKAECKTKMLVSPTTTVVEKLAYFAV